jgi:hypothetical protein
MKEKEVKRPGPDHPTSIQRCPSADANSQAGAAKWGTKCSRITRK